MQTQPKMSHVTFGIYLCRLKLHIKKYGICHKLLDGVGLGKRYWEHHFFHHDLGWSYVVVFNCNWIYMLLSGPVLFSQNIWVIYFIK